MKDKYYIPDIEEFHVGFEYEAHADPRTDEGWDKEIADASSLKYCTDEDSDTDYRVKYLDREDIESLGWKFKSEHKGNKIIVFTKDTYELHLRGDFKTNIVIFYIIDENNESGVFNGNIRNISELKVLMKQTNIK